MLETIKSVIEIAEKAGAVILDIYHNATDLEIQSKADDSPLTKADQAANDVICDGLNSLGVDYPIISEENKQLPYAERKDYDYFWLVDPLDGTKEFIKKNGEFTVNIALVHKNTVVAGVVYAPVLEEMYWAIKGEGAFIHRNGESQKLECTAFSMNDEGLRVVCSRSHLNEETQAYIDALDNPGKVSKGSSLKFLILAKGDAELYPRIAPTMEWDTAAAQIILEEAGGKVYQYGSDAPLMYNKEDLLNPFFIAEGTVLAS